MRSLDTATAIGENPRLLPTKQPNRFTPAKVKRPGCGSRTTEIWRERRDSNPAAGGTPVRADQIQTSWYGAAGANVSIPLSNGFEFSARAKEADLRAKAASEQVLNLRDMVARDVRSAVLNAQIVFKRIGVTQQLLDQANTSSNSRRRSSRKRRRKLSSPMRATPTRPGSLSFATRPGSKHAQEQNTVRTLLLGECDKMLGRIKT